MNLTKDIQQSTLNECDDSITESEFSEFLESNGLLRQKSRQVYQQLKVQGKLEPLEKLLKETLPNYFKISEYKYQDKAECRRVLLERVKKDSKLNSMLELNLQNAEQLFSDTLLVQKLIEQFKEKKSITDMSKEFEYSPKIEPSKEIKKHKQDFT